MCKDKTTMNPILDDSDDSESIDPDNFFNKDAQVVAKDLLGKVLQHKIDNIWLSVRIIETEAYYINERGSHASLGFTEKRKALFMKPGTIYMYYARGGDSLNFSCLGDGNAVLVKSGFPASNDTTMLQKMRQLNPAAGGSTTASGRSIDHLCNGQTLLCKSLGLKVPEWDGKVLDPDKFRIIQNPNLNNFDDGVKEILQTTRLGIPPGRDEHLEYRFIEAEYVKYCTKNPLTVRKNPPKVTKFTQEHC